MPWISLLLSLAALGWGLLTHRRATEAESRLENVRNSHFRLADQLRAESATLKAEIRALREQMRVQQGGARFHEAMTVGEALELDPRVVDVLGAFHIGGCSSCAVSPEDTLRYAAEGNGQDFATVLQALNQLGSRNEGDVARMLERKPNVQISL